MNKKRQKKNEMKRKKMKKGEKLLNKEQFPLYSERK